MKRKDDEEKVTKNTSGGGECVCEERKGGKNETI